MVTLFIDGMKLKVPAGTTILDAARGIGVKIPTLCNFPGLYKRAVCRLCVVECDGGGRLKAACATEVWEGVKVTSQSPALFNMRKEIVELLLSQHPDDCFSCEKNLNCDLQKLAFQFGIKKLSFLKDPIIPKPKSESATLIRDMEKCVKCARCVAACQVEQKVGAISTVARSLDFAVSTPYGDEFKCGPCVFCGRCAAVCPVAAIYQSDEVDLALDALYDPELSTSVVFSNESLIGLTDEFKLPPGTLTKDLGPLLFKRLGFRRVFQRDFFKSIASVALANELLEKLQTPESLPLISSCSTSWEGFIRTYYPSLLKLVSKVLGIDDIYGILNRNTDKDDCQAPEIATQTDSPVKLKPSAFTVSPCLARKFEIESRPSSVVPTFDHALTTRELVRLIKISGMDLTRLKRGQMDPSIAEGVPATDSNEGLNGIARAIYTLESLGEKGRTNAKGESYDDVVEIKVPHAGQILSFVLVFGMAAAAKVFDGIAGGNQNYAFVKVMCCPEGCLEGGGQAPSTLERLRNLREENAKAREVPTGLEALFHEREAFAFFESLKWRHALFRGK
jgi:iron only hydrogenase large subunit-like protein